MELNGNVFCTTGPPALVVFNGTLYCFHEGRDDSGWLWMTSKHIDIATPTISNLALLKGARSSSNEVPYLLPEHAVDGNASSRWSSAYSDPQWLEVDLGQVKNIRSVTIIWEFAFGRDYQIQTSNDQVNWTTIHQVTDNRILANSMVVSGRGRYIRMYGTARGTSYGYSIHEFQVYGF